ncbi:MAG: hypothetical protein IJY28_00010 [Clostridia bacterium]|nr:hypothetical protein [Clostridia bacterium]
MEFWFFTLFIFGILILVLGIQIPIYKEHRKATGGVVNYDSFMRKFVYRVHLSQQEIVDRLRTMNGADELSCTFDFEKSVIRFSEYGSYMDYCFQVLECGDGSVLRLQQVGLVGMKSTVLLKLNPFIVQKLQAEIIPFSQYGF